MMKTPGSHRSPASPAPPRPVIVGEVLYDVFPDGREVRGGAPFNVAWNLRGLGGDPLLVTRVGRDRRGDRVLEAMEAWGLDRTGVQRDPDRPTGIVRVTIDDGAPSYDIVPDQAWDALDRAEARGAVAGTRAAVLYHGTLAARTDAGRAAIGALREAVDAPAYLDVNLRAPWWTPARVREALGHAATVKLNDEELAALDDVGTGSLEDRAVALRRRYAIDTLVVTLGKDGALWLDDGGAHRAEAPPPEPFVDAVGAGDAFAAVTLLGRAGGWDATTTLRRAAGFASAVCGLRGATTDDPRPYRDAVARWRGRSAGEAGD